MISGLRWIMFNAHIAIFTVIMFTAFGFALVDAFKFGALVWNVIF